MLAGNAHKSKLDNRSRKGEEWCGKWMESLWSGETKATNLPRFLRIFWLQEVMEKKIKNALGTTVTTSITKSSRFSWKQDLRVLLNICNEIFRF